MRGGLLPRSNLVEYLFHVLARQTMEIYSIKGQGSSIPPLDPDSDVFTPEFIS